MGREWHQRREQELGRDAYLAEMAARKRERRTREKEAKERAAQEEAAAEALHQERLRQMRKHARARTLSHEPSLQTTGGSLSGSLNAKSGYADRDDFNGFYVRRLNQISQALAKQVRGRGAV